jgi:hypothetical protein
LGKITKNRNRSNPTTARNIINRRKEKFTINTGIIAMMGTIRDAKYRLLEDSAAKPPFSESGRSVENYVWSGRHRK